MGVVDCFGGGWWGGENDMLTMIKCVRAARLRAAHGDRASTQRQAWSDEGRFRRAQASFLQHAVARTSEAKVRSMHRHEAHCGSLDAGAGGARWCEWTRIPTRVSKSWWRSGWRTAHERLADGRRTSSKTGCRRCWWTGSKAWWWW